MKRSVKKLSVPAVIVLLIGALIWYVCNRPAQPVYSTALDNIPEFAGIAYVPLTGNRPEFTQEDMTVDAYERYSSLDSLGRCGQAVACLGSELMPTQERESISHIKPSGWIQGQYEIVEGNSLYNRCHLIGFQLSGENDNERNLITGTRYMNVEGMLPFENMVADYIKETDNHVLYRITPYFQGDDLVASGVQMEGWSVEDGGEGVCFHVYVYNVQPGVAIDYATGENRAVENFDREELYQTTYLLNIRSKKFHTQDCAQGQSISEGNQKLFYGDREELLEMGYTPSGCCDP